jgi:hypothetical protein
VGELRHPLNMGSDNTQEAPQQKEEAPAQNKEEETKPKDNDGD